MKANLTKCGLLRINNDGAVDLVASMLLFARACRIDWTEPGCLAWILTDIAKVTATTGLEWQAKSSKNVRRGDIPR